MIHSSLQPPADLPSSPTLSTPYPYWGGSSPSLLPGTLAGCWREELLQQVHQHSDMGMILFEGIKKTGCYTAWVDFYRGDIGMTPSELGGEEDVSQLRLAISCPG